MNIDVDTLLKVLLGLSTCNLVIGCWSYAMIKEARAEVEKLRKAIT